MIIYMDKSRFETLDEKKLVKIISSNLNGTKFDRLFDYYIGKHDILNYYKKDASAANNKLVSNIAKYITDTSVGYFLGKPVVYSSMNEKFMEEIQKIYDYNDEQDHNIELAKSSSIYGSCFEMIYLDENADIRFTRINPGAGIMIKSSDLEEVLGFIRLISTVDDEGKRAHKVEFWTDTVCLKYSYKSEKLEFIESVPHYFKDVPFTEIVNNEERLGDFEGVITLINAYNKAQSNSANLFQYNDEAILKIIRMGDVSGKDIAEMKENQAIILEDGGDIEWLLKVVDDTALENHKKRLRNDIHIFSNVPDMTDESFGGNLSGVAVSYKLWALEQVTAIKERKFKKALQRRIELITTILNIKGGNYNYMDIEISFRRNKPQNVLEIAQIITMLSGELSRETKLKMLPNIEDVKLELAKIEEEKLAIKSDFGLTTQFLDHIDGEAHVGHKH